ncbi:MAG: efflux RND transporter periplasmic adaptor subunit [Pseudomonadota bacterium]
MTDIQHAQERLPKPTAWKGLIFFLTLIVVGFILAVFVFTQRSSEGPKVVSSTPEAISVEVAPVNAQTSFEIDERFSGLVTPARSSALGFTSGGRIDELYVDVGDRVAAGAILAKLDTRGLSAQLASAQASVAEAVATHSLAVTTVDRQRRLAANGHVSLQAVDEAAAQADTARARIEAARANASALRVQISLATITAPFAGVVTQRFADEGVIANPSQSIFELVERDQLEARIGLTQELARTMVPGAAYELTGAKGEVSTTLRSVTGVIDRNLRTVTAVFDILDPASTTPGEVVRLGVEQTIEERGSWVPVSALAETERGLWSVYVVRQSNGVATAVPDNVEVIHSDGERAYVRGGLRDGDLIVIDGLHRITPGQRVRPNAVADVALTRNEG